jgi:hypothetical protein
MRARDAQGATTLPRKIARIFPDNCPKTRSKRRKSSQARTTAPIGREVPCARPTPPPQCAQLCRTVHPTRTPPSPPGAMPSLAFIRAPSPTAGQARVGIPVVPSSAKLRPSAPNRSNLFEPVQTRSSAPPARTPAQNEATLPVFFAPPSRRRAFAAPPSPPANSSKFPNEPTAPVPPPPQPAQTCHNLPPHRPGAQNEPTTDNGPRNTDTLGQPPLP